MRTVWRLAYNEFHVSPEPPAKKLKGYRLPLQNSLLNHKMNQKGIQHEWPKTTDREASSRECPKPPLCDKKYIKTTT